MEGDLLALLSPRSALCSDGPSLGRGLWGLGRAGEGCSGAMPLTEYGWGMDWEDNKEVEEVGG